MAATGLDEVTVVQNGTTVLRELTLWAAEGELLVVLGPSGSGKSTLLRAVAGLTPIQHGEIVIAGRRVTRLPPHERGVAMIFESSTLVPFLDVARNLGWPLRMQHVPPAEIRQRVAARARELRLTRLLSRMPRTLSTGERGLVGIGRALVRAPDVFLLDEPLAHLDAGQRLSVRRQVVEVVRELGVTTLYVTHDQAEAMAIADRVAMLNDGALAQVGVPLDLYDQPADLFVAGFVGSPPIGLLPARVVVSAGSAGFQVGARTLPLWKPVPPALRDHVGREVVLGLRAEDVHDAVRGYEPDFATVTGTVVGVEYTGSRNDITVEFDAPPVRAPGAGTAAGTGARLRVRFPPRIEVRLGTSVPVAIDASRAHVFDSTTGLALWHPEGTRAATR